MKGESVIGYQFSIIGDELLVMVYRLFLSRILYQASGILHHFFQPSTVICQLSTVLNYY